MPTPSPLSLEELKKRDACFKHTDPVIKSFAVQISGLATTTTLIGSFTADQNYVLRAIEISAQYGHFNNVSQNGILGLAWSYSSNDSFISTFHATNFLAHLYLSASAETASTLIINNANSIYVHFDQYPIYLSQGKVLNYIYYNNLTSAGFFSATSLYLTPMFV